MRTVQGRIRRASAWRVAMALVLGVGAALVPVVAVGPAAAAPVAGAASSNPVVLPQAKPTSCPQYEDELRRDTPAGGWDVALMSSYMARESSCNPAARSARDTGLLQINDINHAYLRTVLGEWVGRWSLTDPSQNIRAAAALCDYWRKRGESCYFPWKLDLLRPPGGTTTLSGTASTPASGSSAGSSASSGSSGSASAPTPASPAPTTTTTAPPPAATSAAGRCTQYEAALAANAPASGWNVARMSRLMSGTSRCDPTRRWATGTGLLRISDSNLAWLSTRLRVAVDQRTLRDPVQNIRAAAALCQASIDRGASCYQPWGATG